MTGRPPVTAAVGVVDAMRDIEALAEGASGFVVPTLGELKGMARLLTASEWEKAAIVATFVHCPVKESEQTSTLVQVLFDSVQFAALGISGLTLRPDGAPLRKGMAGHGTPSSGAEKGVELPTAPSHLPKPTDVTKPRRAKPPNAHAAIQIK